MPADGRQRGGDDGLVERAQEHRQHDAEHDRAHFRMRERARLVARYVACRRTLFGFGFFGLGGHGKRLMPRVRAYCNGANAGVV